MAQCEFKENISLRDYFAAMAMQRLITASGDALGGVDYEETTIAQSAYAMADAMLAQKEA